MSYSAYIDSTPFRLAEPEATNLDRLRHLLEEVFEDYASYITLGHEGSGNFVLEMHDTTDVGDSFMDRIEQFCRQAGPLVANAFEVKLRNCDTASDDRDFFYVAGPSINAIEALKTQQALSRALDALEGLPGHVSDLVSEMRARMKRAEGRTFLRPRPVATETAHMSLRLDVEYQLNGEDPSLLQRQLMALANRAAGEGMLSGSLDAEVETWSAVVTEGLVQSPAPDIPKVALFVEGGVLQDVVASVDVEAILVDYDTKEADPAEVVQLDKHGEEGSDPAVVKHYPVHVFPGRVQVIRGAADSAEARHQRTAPRGG